MTDTTASSQAVPVEPSLHRVMGPWLLLLRLGVTPTAPDIEELGTGAPVN